MRSAIRNWLYVFCETWLDHPARFPEIAAKAVAGRIIYKLGPEAFFLADLHNRPIGSWRHYMTFWGNFSRGIRAINWNSDGFRLARDKLLATERCASAGVAHAPILAIVGRADIERGEGCFPLLGSVDEVVKALATMPDRLFIKPATGLHGKGVAAVQRTADGWRQGDQIIAAELMAERLLAQAPFGGLLIQPRLCAHPEVARLMAGEGLGTVRFLVALTDSGSRAVLAALKILGGDSLTDNFHGGTTGNFLAAVDMESGRIAKVFGRKPGRQLLLHNPAAHPVTAMPLVGAQLPLWPETVAFAEKAASAFPEIPLAGLDIAITADGPMFIETNTEWSPTLAQLATGEGVKVTLRRLWPKLAVPEHVKTAAAQHFGL